MKRLFLRWVERQRLINEIWMLTNINCTRLPFSELVKLRSLLDKHLSKTTI